MSKYAIGDHEYKVSFSGFAYAEADSAEEAMEKYNNDDFVYKEVNPGKAEEVETMVIDL